MPKKKQKELFGCLKLIDDRLTSITGEVISIDEDYINLRVRKKGAHKYFIKSTSLDQVGGIICEKAVKTFKGLVGKEITLIKRSMLAEKDSAEGTFVSFGDGFVATLNKKDDITFIVAKDLSDVESIDLKEEVNKKRIKKPVTVADDDRRRGVIKAGKSKDNDNDDNDNDNNDNDNNDNDNNDDDLPTIKEIDKLSKIKLIKLIEKKKLDIDPDDADGVKELRSMVKSELNLDNNDNDNNDNDNDNNDNDNDNNDNDNDNNDNDNNDNNDNDNDNNDNDNDNNDNDNNDNNDNDNNDNNDNDNNDNDNNDNNDNDNNDDDNETTVSEIKAFSKKEIKAFITKNELDVDPKEFKKLEDLQEAVIDEMGLNWDNDDNDNDDNDDD